VYLFGAAELKQSINVPGIVYSANEMGFVNDMKGGSVSGDINADNFAPDAKRFQRVLEMAY